MDPFTFKARESTSGFRKRPICSASEKKNAFTSASHSRTTCYSPWIISSGLLLPAFRNKFTPRPAGSPQLLEHTETSSSASKSPIPCQSPGGQVCSPPGKTSHPEHCL